jgi:sarcosine oxidase subunit delta
MGEKTKDRARRRSRTDPAAWCDYVHMNKCTAGVQKEWWFHRDGCGSWFTTWRDTTNNLEVEQPEARK